MQKTKRKQLKTSYTMKTKLFLLAMATMALAGCTDDLEPPGATATR